MKGNESYSFSGYFMDQKSWQMSLVESDSMDTHNCFVV